MIGIKKNLKGFSLLEVLLATTIFVVVILLTSQIFKMTIVGSNRVNKSFLLQENLKTFTETIFREIRMANVSEGYINPQHPQQMFINFSKEDYDPLSGIVFVDNYDAKTYVYLTHDEESGVDRVMVFKTRSGYDAAYYLTPQNINIEYLRFIIREDFSGEEHATQSRVTIFMKARTSTDKDDVELSLQTTVSTRIYDQ